MTGDCYLFRGTVPILNILVSCSAMDENEPMIKPHDASDSVLTPLGSGGWMPSYDRQTASYFFQNGKISVILDFGTGISRLLTDFDYLLEDVERIIGFVSHYHLDHTAGLFYLPPFLSTRSLELYAPGAELYGKPAKELIKGMFAPPLLSKEIDGFLPNTRIHDIPFDGVVIDGVEFRFRIQRKHAHPTVAIRIGDNLAYCTDTEPEYETIGFVKGVKLLMHDVWYEEKAPEDTYPSAMVKEKLGLLGSDGHSSNIAVGLIGREAQVGEVLTIHHNPSQSPAVVHRMASTASVISALEVEPAEDGSSIDC